MFLLHADCKDLLKKLLEPKEQDRIKLPDIMRHPWMNRGYSRRLYPSRYGESPQPARSTTASSRPSSNAVTARTFYSSACKRTDLRRRTRRTVSWRSGSRWDGDTRTAAMTAGPRRTMTTAS